MKNLNRYTIFVHTLDRSIDEFRTIHCKFNSILTFVIVSAVWNAKGNHVDP